MTIPRAYDTFGKWLRYRRKLLDLTQEQLGNLAGCSGAAIRKFEADERKPSRELAHLLAVALQVPQDEVEAFLKMARGIYTQDLPVDAPPTPHISRLQGENLPAPLTSLVDRVNDVSLVSKLLMDPAIRWVTLVGPPGIGKTRLSIQTGRQVLPHFTDGVWFVDLAPLEQAAHLLPAICRALSPSGFILVAELEALANTLKHRQLLLVLDNFEHITDAALEMADLLKRCAGLKVLATSRIPLHIYGEHEFQVPPLSVPPRSAALKPETLLQYEAVQLFTARVRQHQPDFRITTQNASMTIDVCATLDGLPLALELAAASLQRMTLAEMDAALHHMDGGGWIKLLTTSARDLPARQRTLVNVVAWSYTLLTHPQQTLFAQLSLFSKWFDLDAVTAVCDLPSAPDHMPVRDLLEELSDHSLLVRGDIEGVPCWRMLEVIKEFAALQLLSQARPPLQARLLQFLQVNLNELEKDLDFHKHRRFYEIHTASLHTALSWLIARQEAELAFQLVSRLGDFWEQWGFHREGLEFSKQLLALPDPSQPLLRATCLQKASDLAWQVHDFKTSLDFSHQAAELGRLHQLISPQVWHLNRLGRIFIEQERYAEARHALVESITLSRANHSVLNVGIPLAQLGELALFENRIQESKTFLSEAQSHLSQAYPIFWAMITVDMAEIAIQEGDFGHACAWLKRAIPYASLHIRRTLIFLGTLAGYLVSSHPDSEAHLRAATRFYGALHSFTEQFAIRPGTFHRRLNDQCMQIIQERLSPGDFQAELRIGAEWSREKVFSEAILITQECA